MTDAELALADAWAAIWLALAIGAGIEQGAVIERHREYVRELENVSETQR
jgi:hypothetical protein